MVKLLNNCWNLNTTCFPVWYCVSSSFALPHDMKDKQVFVEILMQIFQPWIQKRNLAYAKHKLVMSGFLKYLKMNSLGRLFMLNFGLVLCTWISYLSHYWCNSRLFKTIDKEFGWILIGKWCRFWWRCFSSDDRFRYILWFPDWWRRICEKGALSGRK